MSDYRYHNIPFCFVHVKIGLVITLLQPHMRGFRAPVEDGGPRCPHPMALAWDYAVWFPSKRHLSDARDAARLRRARSAHPVMDAVSGRAHVHSSPVS